MDDEPLADAKTVTLARRLVETGLLTEAEARLSGVRTNDRASDKKLAQWIAGQGLLPADLVNKALAGEPLTLGRYEVRGRVGRGGMGAVLRGHDATLQRDVALKVLPQDAREEDLERFRREAKALATLNHPNVVRIYSFEEEEGVAFFVMQLVEGPSLERRLKGRTFSEDEAWRLLTHSAQALSQAEAAGILHRDVKPGNILCEGEGDEVVYRLCDFGLARFDREDAGHLTQVGYTIGTPAYMSPEQAKGEDLDARSDMYGLALAMHQALTGEVPFEKKGQNIAVMLTRRIREDVPDVRDAAPEVSAELASLLRDMAARDRKKRPANWTALLARLKRRSSRGASVSRSSARLARERRASASGSGAAKPNVPTLPLALAVVALSALGGALVAGLGGGSAETVEQAGRVPEQAPGPDAEPTPDAEPDPEPEPDAEPEAERAQPNPTPTAKNGNGNDGNDGNDGNTGGNGDKGDNGNEGDNGGNDGDGAAITKAEGVPRPWDRALRTGAEYHQALTAAEAGDVEAMARVGEFLLRQDPEKGLYWLKRAGDLGSGLALRLRADAHERGIGVHKSSAEALRWLRLAAEAGDTEAMFRVGQALRGSEPKQARELFLRAAQAGHVLAMRAAGLALERGLGGPKNGAEALRWYRQAAKAGDAYAMHNAGALLYAGALVPRDHLAAREFFRQAVAKQPKLGGSWTYLGLLETDRVQRFTLLTKAAELGERYAMHHVALALFAGDGAPKNPGEAVTWLRKAAAKGHPASMGRLGDALARGEGVAADPRQALAWHRKAAEAGDAAGQFALGLAHELGEGADQDDARALELYRAAAEQGHAEASAALESWELLGTPSIEADWSLAFPSRRSDLAARVKLGATADSESAVQGALDWLARHQLRDGRWTTDWARRCGATACAPGEAGGDPRYDLGLTALSALAFLGRGHHHAAEGPYKAKVRAALRALIVAQDREGFVGLDPEHPETIYNHALATLALCEAHGITGDEDLRDPAEMALSACLSAQNPGSGWKYGVRSGRSDTSVTAWMAQALAAGARAGLGDPATLEEALRGARAWFLSVIDEGVAGYETPGGPSAFLKQSKGKFARLPVMTAAALLGRVETRERKLTRQKTPRRLLSKNPPQAEPTHANFYYWYYGSAALFHVSSREFKPWNKRLLAALLPLQRRGGCGDGSWDPLGEWCPVGGRVYATALAALTLEVTYRRERR